MKTSMINKSNKVYVCPACQGVCPCRRCEGVPSSYINAQALFPDQFKPGKDEQFQMVPVDEETMMIDDSSVIGGEAGSNNCGLIDYQAIKEQL
jgi:hypothetical protein